MVAAGAYSNDPALSASRHTAGCRDRTQMMEEDRKTGGPRVAAIERGVNVLNCFLGPKSKLSLTEISTETGFYKSTALRLCSTLVDLGYLAKTADGTYALGPMIGALSNRYDVANFVDRDKCLAEMADLNKTFGESVALYVPIGAEQMCFLRIESPMMVRAAVNEGDRIPIGDEAGGMVIKAFRGEVGEDYDAIRKSGIAVSTGVVSQNAFGVAAPILHETFGLMGALVIIGPKERMPPKTVKRMQAALRDVAQRLNR